MSRASVSAWHSAGPRIDKGYHRLKPRLCGELPVLGSVPVLARLCVAAHLCSTVLVREAPVLGSAPVLVASGAPQLISAQAALCGEHPVLGSVPVQPHPVRCISIDIQQCAADASHRCSFAAAATTMALLMLLTSVCCRCCRRRSQRCGCNWHHCNQITSVAQQLLLEANHSCLSKNPCCSGMQLQRIIAQQRIANNIGKQDGDFAERVLAIHRCARLSTRPPPWRPASGPKAKPQRVA